MSAFKSAVLSLLVYFSIALFTASPNASDQLSQTKWTANESILLYFEALSKIKAHDITQPTDLKIVQQSVKGYLRNVDPYSDYLTAEEYAVFINAQKSQYVGLGMDIEKNDDGQVICFPYPESPAAQAGIQRGAVLLAIEGADIADKALFAVGARLLGREGTAVTLTIRNPQQPSKTLSLKRQSVSTDSVILEMLDSLPVIKILYFRADTPRIMKTLLNNLPASKPIIIDLLDNPGGDLYRGIDCAMLFLKGKTKIVDIQRSTETKSFKSADTAVNTSAPLYLWQNERTASTAEMFIAALTQNERAVSIGKKTYGKGTTQDVVKLSDGSVIIITSGYLIPPNGRRYHQKGLAPTYLLKAASSTTDDYLAKVKQLVKKVHKTTASRIPTQPPAPKTPKSKKPTIKNSIPQIEISVPPPDKYFICFHNGYESEREAEIEAKTLRRAYDHLDNQVLLQKEDRKFYICLGPYLSPDQAVRKGNTITQITGRPVFIFHKTLQQRSDDD